jgi:hypothetical protein
MERIYKKAKVGDLVETCSLMPGVIMNKRNNEIEVRQLQYDNETYKNQQFSCCSIGNCGIVLLTPEQVLTRLTLGKEKLSEMWSSVDTAEEYYALLNETDIIYASW